MPSIQSAVLTAVLLTAPNAYTLAGDNHHFLAASVSKPSAATPCEQRSNVIEQAIEGTQQGDSVCKTSSRCRHSHGL